MRGGAFRDRPKPSLLPVSRGQVEGGAPALGPSSGGGRLLAVFSLVPLAARLLSASAFGGHASRLAAFQMVFRSAPVSDLAPVSLRRAGLRVRGFSDEAQALAGEPAPRLSGVAFTGFASGPLQFLHPDGGERRLALHVPLQCRDARFGAGDRRTSPPGPFSPYLRRLH